MISIEQIKHNIDVILKNQYHTTAHDASYSDIHNALGQAVMGGISEDWNRYEEDNLKIKTASYFSAEFLMGRLVYNNLLCLGITDEVDQMLADKGSDLKLLEHVEDAALGNGGLGRLAACFLDSAATVDVPLNGYGIRYKYGIFKQLIEDGFQKEVADNWTALGDPWSIRRDNEAVKISFKDQTINAIPYDMPIIGYGSGRIGTLRLWEAEPLEPFDFDLFNDQKYDEAVAEKNRAEDISRVLYPNDDSREGKVLRLKQQYFFSSASIQDLLRDFDKNYDDISMFNSFNAIQLNDTHPIIAIPEFIRIVVEEKGLSFEDAFKLSQKTFNYTNHTIMSEALESWSLDIVELVAPALVKYIQLIDQRLVEELTNQHNMEPALVESLQIIQNGKVQMANIGLYCTNKVNGVAALHSSILQTRLFKDWHRIYPSKIINKTNGVTQRRWIKLCNPELSQLFTNLLGNESWLTDLDQLKNLEHYVNDPEVLTHLYNIKHRNKEQLSRFLKDNHSINVDPNTIFDTQVKRIHEYKRQFLNILTIIALYQDMKAGNHSDFVPTTFFFGGKSAPGYHRAKAIIKLIGEVSRVIEADPEVSGRIKVVFMPNYNVSAAEYVIAATEVSEQVSTAGTEASGTGNMKFMMNGAVTIGTYDGANVEIFQEAGAENNYVFGASAQEVEEHRSGYDPVSIYESNSRIKAVLDTLIDGTFDDGGTKMFSELYDSLLKPSYTAADQYFLLYDFESYLAARLKLNGDYKDKHAFAKKCWLNIVNSGKFSSDRTIKEYAEEIWQL